VNVPYIGKETQDWDLKAGANHFVFFALKKSKIQKAIEERFERSYILKWLSFSTCRKVVRGIDPTIVVRKSPWASDVAEPGFVHCRLV
jgi:hypothetical protein